MSKASSTLLLVVTLRQVRLFKQSLNLSMLIFDITRLFMKLFFELDLAVGKNIKLIKWSLISLSKVPTFWDDWSELVKIWSMEDIEVPCILVALVINCKKPLLIIVSM